MFEAFGDRIRAEGVGAVSIRREAGSGHGGNAKERDYHLTSRAIDEVSHIRVAYEHAGTTVADEVLPLSVSAKRD